MREKVKSDKIRLRPEQAADEGFLRNLHASTQLEELAAAGLPLAAREGFLAMQFDAQRRGYRSAYPNAAFDIIQLEEISVGRIVVHRTESEILLVDIALLPEFRNQGIGTGLIDKLLSEAAVKNLPLRLNVIKGHRAARLYQRLGFKKMGEAGFHDAMEWRAW